MPNPHDRGVRTPRRDFLRLAALAPVAAAGCAGLKVGPPGEPVAGPTPAEAGDPLAAVREFPLPPGAEPALVFRARVARGRAP
jgi:hypothetical protein